MGKLKLTVNFDIFLCIRKWRPRNARILLVPHRNWCGRRATAGGLRDYGHRLGGRTIECKTAKDTQPGEER